MEVFSRELDWKGFLLNKAMNAAPLSAIYMISHAISTFLSINIDTSYWLKRLYVINSILLLLCIYGPQIFQSLTSLYITLTGTTLWLIASLIIVRLIIFIAMNILTFGRIQLWLLPNVTRSKGRSREDQGLDSSPACRMLTSRFNRRSSYDCRDLFRGPCPDEGAGRGGWAEWSQQF